MPLERTLRNQSDANVLNLRPRDQEKEIAGLFRFKPVDTSERIADTLADFHGVEMPKQFRQEKPNSPKRKGFNKRNSSQGGLIR